MLTSLPALCPWPYVDLYCLQSVLDLMLTSIACSLSLTLCWPLLHAVCPWPYVDLYCLQSVIARGMLNEIADKDNYVPVFINFSAQTSSNRTQEMIESKLEKKRKNIIGKCHWGNILCRNYIKVSGPCIETLCVFFCMRYIINAEMWVWKKNIIK